MSLDHRIVLGRYADAAEGAARLRAPERRCAAKGRDTAHMVKAVVERVRRHFGIRDKGKGNRYARVAYAWFRHRNWRKAGLPKTSFFHALKKIKDFLERANTG